MSAAATAVDLARWQFALTTLFHFIFVPLTLGLAPLLAVSALLLATGVEILPSGAIVWKLTLGRLLVLIALAALIASGARLRDFYELLGERYELHRIVRDGLWPLGAYRASLEIAASATNYVALRR